MDENRQIISLLDQQAASRSKLVNLGNEESRIAQKFAIAQAQAQDRLASQASNGVREIAQAQAAYQQLTEAHRQYDAAVKVGNNVGQAYGQQNAVGALREITAMASTQQQNTFLALMNDMAKGAEGGSRAFELYAGAMNAAGTSAAKFAVWQESVTAAQGRLEAAMQGVYSLLDAEWMKGVYNGRASIADAFTAGSEAMNGWNLKLPLIAVGLGAVVIVTLKIVAAVQALQAAAAAGGLLGALSGGTMGLIAAGIGMVVATITLLAGSIKKTFEPVGYSEQIGKLSGHRDDVCQLTDEYTVLAVQGNKSLAESTRMNAVLEQLAGSFLALRSALTRAPGGFVDQTETVKALNRDMDTN